MLVVLPTWLVVQHVNTIAHEGTHALVGSGMGGTVQSVTMQPDGRGLTLVRFPAAAITSFSSSPDTLAPQRLGLGAAKLISIGHTVAVLWLALLLLALLLITVRNLFAGCAIVITGLLIYLVARYAAIGTETVVAYFITWFLLLSGFRVDDLARPGCWRCEGPGQCDPCPQGGVGRDVAGGRGRRPGRRLQAPGPNRRTPPPARR